MELRMKKLTLLLTIILTSVFIVFGQPSSENVKTDTSDKAVTKAAKTERVKFDPTRNAAADLQEAITLAKKKNKRIILDVGGEWCGWCRLMDNYFLKNDSLSKLRDKNFIWVKINYSEENENKEFLSAYPQIPGYPHLYVLEKDGTFLYSKSTSELEEGKSYNLQKFTDFLNEWSPKKK